MLLQNLSYADVSLQKLAAPKFEDLVRSREPKNPRSLQYVLTILARAGCARTILEVAKERVPGLPNDRPRQMEWLTAWFQLNPNDALDSIERLSPEESRSAVADLASRLGDLRRLPSAAKTRPAFLEVSVLKRLIPLVFRHTPAATEADFGSPVGAMVSMGLPDARFFRELILQELAGMAGDEPYGSLLELARTPGLEDQRARLLQLAERQAANDCERAFAPEEVYRWEQDCVGAPKTSDDLFRVVLRRLEVVKRDVEHGDFSDRVLFNASTREPVLQKYLANRLRTAARGQYSVHREEEVDLQNRTDIRLWHPKDLVATIEVKCANKWSYAELRDSLENQLVGKYLRDQNSHHGILLLGHLGKKDYWPAPDRTKLSFEDLKIALNMEAEKIAKSNSQVSSLAVFGIDFRPNGSPDPNGVHGARRETRRRRSEPRSRRQRPGRPRRRLTSHRRQP